MEINMFNKVVLFFILISIALTNSILSQVIIHGIVKDSQTGLCLPVANIQVEGTYRGTITNNEGKFNLKINKFPATLLITYIGYFPERIIIEDNKVNDLIVLLQPTVIIMPEIVVDSEDPAVRIMQKVIEIKQEWWDKLLTYKAEAFCRTTFSNDTGIVMIKENISESYWDKKKGSRDIIKSMRQSADTGGDFLPTVGYFPNFYQDNIEVAGFDMINIIHPDALKYYQFQLIGEQIIGDKIMYDIAVNSNTKLQPVFKGKISVLVPDYALAGIDLETADHIIYPMPMKNVYYHFKQQFSNFGNKFWLPISLVREGEGTIVFPGVEFPPIKFKDIYEIKDYTINLPLPDSLFENNKNVCVDSSSIKNDSLFTRNDDLILPLTDDEEQAYNIVDTTFSFIRAFRPRGMLAKFIIKEAEKEDNAERAAKEKAKKKRFSYKPQVWFNRVDGLHIGLDNSFELKKDTRLSFFIGYTTALKRSPFGARFKYKNFELEYYRGTDVRYNSELYSRFITGLITLIGRPDYYDYYWNERFRGGFNKKFNRMNTVLFVGLNNEKHTSLKKNTDFDILSQDYIQRENPVIKEGWLRSILFQIQYGSNFIPFGILGQKRAALSVEHSSKDIFASDFLFTRYQLTIDWRIQTFLKRRFMPNAIDIRVVAGTYTGELPIQKFGAMDVGLGSFASFGSFKSLRNYPYEGEKYLAVFWEHNFRTVPFEILGIRTIAKNGIELILHGASGRTWINEERLKKWDYLPNYLNSFHSEIGLSLNKLFNIFRIDFTNRLNSREFYFSISAPKLM